MRGGHLKGAAPVVRATVTARVFGSGHAAVDAERAFDPHRRHSLGSRVARYRTTTIIAFQTGEQRWRYRDAERPGGAR
jgi:hypothetical protein